MRRDDIRGLDANREGRRAEIAFWLTVGSFTLIIIVLRVVGL